MGSEEAGMALRGRALGMWFQLGLGVVDLEFTPHPASPPRGEEKKGEARGRKRGSFALLRMTAFGGSGLKG